MRVYEKHEVCGTMSINNTTSTCLKFSKINLLKTYSLLNIFYQTFSIFRDIRQCTHSSSSVNALCTINSDTSCVQAI